MLTKNFNIGPVTGTLQRYNHRGGEIDKALLFKLLAKVYPELDPDGIFDDHRKRSYMGSIRTGSVAYFVELATQIVEIHGLTNGSGEELDWPNARTGTPEQIKAVYEHYLYGDPELWDTLEKMAAELNNPNGTLAGVLTPEQTADPLSESSDGNTSSS